MRSVYPAKRDLIHCERGFTLVELLVTIAILGILMGIATSTWQGAIEGRQADSAANQLVSDLRLAHTQSTNRLETVEVVLDNGEAEYMVGGEPRELEDDMKVLSPDETLTFHPEGNVDPGGDNIDIEVGAESGDPSRDIEITPATSQVVEVPT